MTQATKTKPIPRLIAIIVAPLTWLERVRGWKRRALVFLYMIPIVLIALMGWRALSLRGLPDLQEPFDTKAYGRIHVSDDNNAFVLYRKAAARLTPVPKGSQNDFPQGVAPEWSKASPELRSWVTGNDDAIALWLEGSKRSDALSMQPMDLTISSPLPVEQAMRLMGSLTSLEGTRREAEGDLEGSWVMYQGILRSSRLIGKNGPMISRLAGHALLRHGGANTSRWMKHPRMTTALLRTAMNDVAACIELTPQPSEMVRAEYFVTNSALNGPEQEKLSLELRDENLWYNHLPMVPKAIEYFRREPERSQRVLRLITAGYLAQCDRPPSSRPRLAFGKYMIYNHDSETPDALRKLSPQELRAWAESSMARVYLPAGSRVLSTVDYELPYLNGLHLQLAECAFRLDHGRPMKRYGELLGKYVKVLPDGYAPDDAPLVSDVEFNSDR
jgi:hypothetical protein